MCWNAHLVAPLDLWFTFRQLSAGSCHSSLSSTFLSSYSFLIFAPIFIPRDCFKILTVNLGSFPFFSATAICTLHNFLKSNRSVYLMFVCCSYLLFFADAFSTRFELWITMFSKFVFSSRLFVLCSFTSPLLLIQFYSISSSRLIALCRRFSLNQFFDIRFRSNNLYLDWSELINSNHSPSTAIIAQVWKSCFFEDRRQSAITNKNSFSKKKQFWKIFWFDLSFFHPSPVLAKPNAF